MSINITTNSTGSRGFRVLFDKLTRYCLSEIAVPAILAMLIIGFVGVANELRERREPLNQFLDYISGWEMARLVLYFSPTLVAYLIPVAFMMGILLAFGRLAQNNEITAMKAAGIPLKRLVLPVVIVGALLSVLTFFLQDRVQPQAIARANKLIFEELPQRVTLDVLPVGVMKEFGGVRVYFNDRDPATKLLRDIVVIQEQSGRNTIYRAETAQFVNASEDGGEAKLVLRKCRVVRPLPGGDKTDQTSEEVTVSLAPSLPLRGAARHKALTVPELIQEEKRATESYKHAGNKRNAAENLRTIRTEISDRITLPLACLAVSLAAAPLAVRAPRSGRSYSFAIGIALLGGYYLLRILLEAKSVHPLEDYIVRGLVPNIALCLVGLWALWRVDRV
ncbi:MAG: LptF/LptG family permease [Candidatus Hydrogenedentes bacterium]|nr:LptF/LptG family permease [Candidatus Hydrogenedentota bacterium]